jgi:hypothetical protein
LHGITTGHDRSGAPRQLRCTGQDRPSRRGEEGLQARQRQEKGGLLLANQHTTIPSEQDQAGVGGGAKEKSNRKKPERIRSEMEGNPNRIRNLEAFLLVG